MHFLVTEQAIKNWGISKGDNGKLYTANNNGLLEYDGLKWTLYQLPNKTTLRSVLVHDNLVYTGSYEDFGYWKKDKKGVLQYTSLTTSIRESITINDEIWQIVPYKETIVFRSFSSLYIYHNDGSIKKTYTSFRYYVL